ncbi:substrate-binding domain-containing protein [Gudongella sp. DL1XJH-153]|uniref:substrate-binding domain-containing protein n=1 Tax=Gudongella sp. DL1XJH-153 TaxID=3409804 RepID=UPI003BB67131
MNKNKWDGFQLYIQLKNKKQISTDKLFSLLENIEKEGSISKAASDMKISYRYAWGLIKDTEELLGIKLLDKKVGGSEGGGATLTKEGREMLNHYQAIRDSVDIQLTALIQNKVEEVGKGQEVEGGDSLKYLLMASSMEPIDTGLLDVLEKEYFMKMGTLVRHIAVGSGKALQIGRSGDVDIVFVHSPDEEKDFMTQGFGGYRRDIMANRYYLVGPESDPAGLRHIKVDAGIQVFFRQISLTDSFFISRGDNSGTHKKELELWHEAGIPTEERNTIVGGRIASNMECLDIAFEKSGYTLVDSTSYKLSEHNDSLRVYAGNKDELDSKLDNIFSAIAVRRHSQDLGKYREAIEFIDWMCGFDGRRIIEGYPNKEGLEPYFHLID